MLLRFHWPASFGLILLESSRRLNIVRLNEPMMNTVLVAEKTVVSAKGDSSAVDMSSAAAGVFLLTLSVTDIIEQESLEVFILGSTDGSTWNPKALATFPQKFYRGETPFVLDLTAHPDVKFIRAHWEVARWGRGTETPMFEFGLSLREIPPEILRDVLAVKEIA